MISPRLMLAGAESKEDIVVCLNFFLGAMTEWNAWLMRKAHRQGVAFPPIYGGRLRYQRENYGSKHPEDWRDAVEVVKFRGGDCEDLACYRAAELRLAGQPQARPVYRVKPRRVGGRLWHIVVWDGVGALDDPSKRLGM